MDCRVLYGDCLDLLPDLPDASVDAVVTDPPYELGFMGRAWDATGIAYNLGLWRECLRVLRPGGHLVAFGGTRTFHRLACAVEDAGFEIRDSVGVLGWVYGSGFPKSLDVSKAIDKAVGAQREVVGQYASPEGTTGLNSRDDQYGFGVGDMSKRLITAPATDDARRWAGWGTALKPAWEPVILARRPLAGTVAANVVAHGTGALNVDASRVAHGADVNLSAVQRQSAATAGMSGLGPSGFAADHTQPLYAPAGRWPTNVVLCHAPALDGDGRPVGDACAQGCVPGCPVADMDGQSGPRVVGWDRNRPDRATGDVYGTHRPSEFAGYGDSGGASRFFPVFRYAAKAPTRERPKVDGVAHPTVKPLALMRWLARLVTPPGGTILDPFAGSGATVEAAILEGFGCVAIEREADYLPLIDARIERTRRYR